jgi:hypothetical protein
MEGNIDFNLKRRPKYDIPYQTFVLGTPKKVPVRLCRLIYFQVGIFIDCNEFGVWWSGMVIIETETKLIVWEVGVNGWE